MNKQEINTFIETMEKLEISGPRSWSMIYLVPCLLRMLLKSVNPI